MIRPTHVLDPEIVICPREGQLERLLREISATCRANDRALVMAVTKRDAEDVAAWLVDEGVRASFIHSDLNTVERAEVLQQLQGGACEVLVGVNLLREGLDLPQVGRVVVLQTLNPKPLTLHPTPYTLNPKPWICPRSGGWWCCKP